jgi:hypothetical protein
MSRRAKSIIILLLAAAAVGGALLGRSGRGPIYQGRRTADWVKQALRDQSRSEAFEAVLKIGPPAVPFIARQGLHDKCHAFHSVSWDHVSAFSTRHPHLSRWLHIEDWVDNCARRHDQAASLLYCLGTNAQAAVPEVINCLERCPELHFIQCQDLLDTLGEINGTNSAGLAYLTRCARRNDSLSLRAAALAYFLNGQTNLMVETCRRLAAIAPGQVLNGHELFWLRDDHDLNQHLVPLLEGLYTDPRSTSRDRETILFELQSRSNDATAALSRLLALETNAPAAAK